LSSMICVSGFPILIAFAAAHATWLCLSSIVAWPPCLQLHSIWNRSGVPCSPQIGHLVRVILPSVCAVFAGVGNVYNLANNNNNTFTWSGPSGVGGCTGQARVARLGHAPERATHPLI
jgi:hypothetical protein